MEHTSALLPLAGVWLVAVMTPGPDFLAIVHTTVTHSRKTGMMVVLGVLLGMTCWFLAALAGLGVLFAHWPWLFLAVKTAGALYLLVVGVQLIAGKRGSTSMDDGLMPRNTLTHPAPWAIRRGLFTNLGNPKALALFGSLFAVVLPPGGSLLVQGTALLILLGIPALWYPLVVFALSHRSIRRAFGRMAQFLDRLTGGLFLLLGIRLATTGD